MPIERRQRLLELADEYGVAVFEDDCYADLVWSGERPPAIYALDQQAGGRRVLYCGTFSKSIAPALRIGYIVADWAALGQMVPLKKTAARARWHKWHWRNFSTISSTIMSPLRLNH